MDTLRQPVLQSTGKTLAVHCRKLTKSFGDGPEKVQALRGIDLDIKTGELMMLVGPSGCGKTTLISILAATLDYDGGNCEVFGRELKGMTTAEKNQFRSKHIGFVFQSFNLLPTLRAYENAAVPLIINGMARKQAFEKAKAMLERLELKQRMHAYPSQLSGGQQQRVAIARSLVHDPRLIVCDEPTSALDHDTGLHVIELLREVALSNQRTLVIVTHDARIFGYADRIARMDDGSVVEVGEKAQMLAQPSHAH